MTGFLNEIILRLYIRELSLREVQHSVDSCSDPSEWPSDYLTHLIEVASSYYDTRAEAESLLGKSELQLQCRLLLAQCGHS